MLIRSLLPSRVPNRSVDVIVETGLGGRFMIVTTAELRQEVLDAVSSKPWLTQRITTERAGRFLAGIERTGMLLPTALQAPPRRCRDERDDYLLAYAESAEIDVLVTDDDDLLTLDGAFPFRILPPPAFLAVLRERGLA